MIYRILIRNVYVYVSLPIVLEELGGGTLPELIERKGGILPRGQALDIARQLACALQHIQEDLSPFAMIIHRGITSSWCCYNIIVTHSLTHTTACLCI